MAQGSITKRLTADGKARYLVRVEYPPDPVTGKRRQRAKTFGTRKEAEAELARWLTEIERGTALEPSKLTVGEYLAHWLGAYAATNVRPTTYRSYEQLIRVHLVPALGHIPLQKLSPAHLQAFYSDRLARGRADGTGGLAPRTVRYLHSIVREALAQAVRWQLVARNVADATEPPRAVRPHVQTWDTAQLRRFLTFAQDDEHYGPVWLVAVATGLRRGEVLGLRWEDVDLERGRLHIRRSLVEIGSALHIQEPKTESSRRVLPVPAEVVAALRAHRARQAEHRLRLGPAWQDHGLVFTTASGGPIAPRNLLRRFKALAEAAGLPPIPFHGLRHAHATALLRDGIPAKVVSERLGHSSISLTLDTYSHVLPGMQRQAAGSIDVALFGEPASSVNTA
jgi:integrase